MNEELTREVLEAMKMCKHVCALCSVHEVCSKHDWQALAAALLEERAKPKVWDGAPEWAKSAIVIWSDTCKNEPANRRDYSPRYTRELPKTRIDKIVDEVLDGYLFGLRVEKGELTEILKSALNKYAEELEGKK